MEHGFSIVRCGELGDSARLLLGLTTTISIGTHDADNVRASRSIFRRGTNLERLSEAERAFVHSAEASSREIRPFG
jgi:hypothetical protein